MTYRLPLTKGLFALIDDEDVVAVTAHKWRAIKSSTTSYARCNVGQEVVSLHRFVMDAPPLSEVDHVNRYGLDCRKANLRFATRSQNNANRLTRPSASGYRGVFPSLSRWQAIASVGGKLKYLGTFDSPEDAAAAKDSYVSQHHGEFAVLNFPAIVSELQNVNHIR